MSRVSPREPHIPVFRPRLPSADAIRPYLETLDRTRLYSNHGPLERQFAASMSGLFGFDMPVTATASSGTAALAGAILARAGRASGARRLCLCPAYTFVATAGAVEQCGYQLHFIDIDEKSWAPLPDKLLTHPALAEAGLVVVVAPYGRPVPQEPWQRFQALTGIPVVIDGAASLESLADRPELYLGSIPVVLSFHATKVFATGEGGAVVTTDADLLRRSIQAMNFGFYGARRADTTGFNGKMSEYHAAVGLAELDGWAEKRAEFRRVCDLYRDCALRHNLGERLITAPLVASTYVLFESASVPEAESVRAALTESDVEYRYWYGLGLHREPYFEAAACDEVPGVESLAPRLLGLPTALDLGPPEVERIVGAVAHGRDRASDANQVER
jgi:dTDP-4-amino-4,6-dideoxygalactose transaminase